MPQLNPAWFSSQLFWLLISVAVLYVALSRYVLPPLLAVLELRHATREGDLAEATALEKQAEAAQADYEQALLDARSRAQTLFAEVEAQGRQTAEKSLSELNRTLHARMGEADTRIGKSKQALEQALAPAIAGLVSLAVEKLVDKRPDDKQVAAVVNRMTS